MKKFINENKDNVIIGIVSVIAFLFGCLSKHPILSLVVIGTIDLLLFVPNLLKKYKAGDTMAKKKKAHATKHKTQKVQKTEKKKWKKVLKILLIIFFVCCILGFIGLGVGFFYIAKTAPKFNPDNLFKQESSTFYNIKGEVMGTVGTEKRELVTYDELPEVLINAIVATEDARFFQHNGVDWARFLKATLYQLIGKNAGGASTLTMQISKNDFTDTTSQGIKGIIRKFKDVYVSINQIEKRYTKQEIMEFYVNSYYLGGSSYGVEQACQTYFGKSVADINLAEASIIAGLFQAPNAYDPLRYPEKTEVRRKTVLNLMVRHGYITEEQKDAALAIPVESLLVKTKDETNQDQWLAFTDTVVEEIIDRLGEEYNPYKRAMDIYTTMDPEKQDYINKLMNGESWKWENDKVTAGIAALDIKTGAIVAVGAGRNRPARSFNTATDTKKQIGSTAKPLYDYGPGIEYENWSTYLPFPDERYSYSGKDGKEINNWDVKYEGFLSSRNALAHSRNTSALKAFQANKNANIKTFVTSLGLHPEGNGGSLHEAHAIGGYTGESPLSMAAAYAAFANGGYYNEPYSYTKIVLKNSGEEIENKTIKKRAMSEETAYMVYDMLKTTGKYALGNQSNINGAEFGAKTGTSNYTDEDKKRLGYPSNAINDYWVTGVSADYAISVWYGYLKNYSTKKDAPEETYCKNCYNTINEIYHRKLFQATAKGFFQKGSTIKKPDGVVEVEVENETYPGSLPSAYTPDNMKVKELFKKGTEPTDVSNRYAQLENVTNLKGTVSDNVVSLTWTGIKTPEAIDETALKNYFSKFWKNTSIPLNARKNYNNKNIGNLVYKIYAVDKSGNLTLVDTTSDTKTSIKVNSSSSDTYVVKSSYSIFTKNMSSGTSVTVSLDGVASEITASLNGTNPYVWTGTYTEDGVKIVENGTDVTSKATVKTTYKKEDGTIITVDTMKTTGTYTVTYEITYQTFTKTLTRTIVIP